MATTNARRAGTGTTGLEEYRNRIMSGERSLQASIAVLTKFVDVAADHLRKEPAVRRLDAERAVIIGDLHGDVKTFNRIFEAYPLGEYTYICLGDYVDRSRTSTEMLAVLVACKLTNPGSFFMLRGDHESPIGALRPQEFPEELTLKAGSDDDALLHKIYNTLFAELPIAIILNGKYFLVHGGIPVAQDGTLLRGAEPRAIRLEELMALKKVLDPNSNRLIYQMLWNDRHPGKGWENGSRGVGMFRYGTVCVENFLMASGLEGMIRGHQHGLGGYDITGKTITITSTTAYRGDVPHVAVLEKGELKVNRLGPMGFLDE